MDDSGYFSARNDRQPTRPGRFLKVDQVRRVPVSEGLEFRPVVGQGMLCSFVTFAPHTEAPRHTHSEEQMVIVLEGEIQFDLDGDVRTIRRGDVVAIPPWVPHGAWTLESGCRELDVFSPPRSALLDLLTGLDEASTAD